MAVRRLTSSTPVQAFVDHADPLLAAGGSLTIRAGEDEIVVAGPAAAAVVDALRQGGSSKPARAVPELLTTGQAAKLLGVSRPTVVALIERGELAATRVGTHRRVRTADAIAYRERGEARRAAALTDLTALSQELGLYDG